MRNVNKTLLEQMKFSDREIEKRKTLFELSDEDVRILRSCRRKIVDHLDWAINEFYTKQIDDPEIALIIGDAETLSRLSRAMRGYIVELFSGTYDDDYVNSRLRVGKIHWRIGVTPKFFLSALRRLFVVLSSIIEDTAGSPEEARRQKEAILKVLFFDSQLVFDTYINALSSEVLAAKDEAADYAEGLEEEVARRTRQLEELALTDELTGIANKRAFQDHAHRELAAAHRHGNEIALLFIDINDFKVMNDTNGHQAGDEALKLVADVLISTARESDIVSRIGGDEFCVLMPGAGEEAAIILGNRFATALEDKAGTAISASIGVAVTGPVHHASVEELLEDADKSMYKAKHLSKASAADADDPGHVATIIECSSGGPDKPAATPEPRAAGTAPDAAPGSPVRTRSLAGRD